MEPFIFRSFYHCVKGVASDTAELESEMSRLNRVDPGCVLWHLESNHISRWLLYMGEKRLSDSLSRSESVEDAIRILRRTNSRRKSASPGKTGQGRKSSAGSRDKV